MTFIQGFVLGEAYCQSFNAFFSESFVKPTHTLMLFNQFWDEKFFSLFISLHLLIFECKRKQVVLTHDGFCQLWKIRSYDETKMSNYIDDQIKQFPDVNIRTKILRLVNDNLGWLYWTSQLPLLLGGVKINKINK